MVGKVIKAEWQTQAKQLDELTKLAWKDLDTILEHTAGMQSDDAINYIAKGLFEISRQYPQMSSNLAIDWWGELTWELSPTAKSTYTISGEQVLKQARWAATPLLEDPKDTHRLKSVVEQWVFDGHRNTIVANCKAQRIAYARLAQPNACAFCRVLASRGAYYTTYRTSFKRKHGLEKFGVQYHDHCRCMVGPKLDHVDLEKGEQEDRFFNEYMAARKAAEKENPGKSVDMKLITKYMRKHGHGA